MFFEGGFAVFEDDVDEFAFGSRITMKSFSADGQKLLVLTDDQNVTLLDLSKTLDSKTAAAKDH